MLISEGDELAVVDVLISFGQIGKYSRRMLPSRPRVLQQQALLVYRLLTRSPFGRPEVMALVLSLPAVGNMTAAAAPDAVERGEDPHGEFTARGSRQKDKV